MNDLIILCLDRGLHAIIDVADGPRVMPYQWSVAGFKYRPGREPYFGIAARIPGLGTVKLHRYLVDANPGEIIDHRNQVCWDCRQSNLRRATIAQNTANRAKFASRSKISRFKGVRLDKRFGTWYATISAQGRTYYTGNFPTEEDAARAYDRLARRHHGDFASLNFPDAVPLDGSEDQWWQLCLL